MLVVEPSAAILATISNFRKLIQSVLEVNFRVQSDYHRRLHDGLALAVKSQFNSAI